MAAVMLMAPAVLAKEEVPWDQVTDLWANECKAKGGDKSTSKCHQVAVGYQASLHWYGQCIDQTGWDITGTVKGILAW
ncbi:hypothetical protein CBOM_00042 [Ceraceosorus bombacis]|uniref:Uncharacterized protein n=1 Tax=Ceraceosorus bombacis TaxID=401625 RepID=A0A0P1B8Z7_9BASI|nr:hypothetical protein CBOM_00042 [Ceraceosorus bombacis]